MSEVNQRGKYLGFVAHEIKNPLATALWSVDLLKRMEGEGRVGPRADKIIDASLRALRRMRRLVEDYFTIERLRQQALELRVEALTAQALVEGALTHLAEKEGLPRERFAANVSDQLFVRGDAELLRRALRAVLETVARAAPEARISLVGHAGDGEVRLVVRGEGLPRPLMPAPPEERASSDPVGAVLGFSLCESVLAAHGGGIEETEEGLLLRLPRA
jgi:K+-sensing histidine kinase KdpD